MFTFRREIREELDKLSRELSSYRLLEQRKTHERAETELKTKQTEAATDQLLVLSNLLGQSKTKEFTEAIEDKIKELVAKL